MNSLAMVVDTLPESGFEIWTLNELPERSNVGIPLFVQMELGSIFARMIPDQGEQLTPSGAGIVIMMNPATYDEIKSECNGTILRNEDDRKQLWLNS